MTEHFAYQAQVPQPEADPPVEPAARGRAALQATRQWLLDTVRLIFLRPLRADRPSGSWIAIFWLGLAGFLAPVVLQFLDVGIDGQWNSLALAPLLFHIPMLLAAAIFIGLAARDLGTPRILMAALGIFLFVNLAFAILQSLVPATHGLRWRVAGPAQEIEALWIALALAIFAGRTVPRGGRRLAIAAACIAFVFVPLGSIYHAGQLWMEPVADKPWARNEERGVGGEAMIFKEASLLDQQLRSVEPARPGEINVFVIGMAGYGGQDVFKREVDSVDALFRERFGARGHTIRLVNNRATVLELPLAAKTSLRAALKRVAETMDKERDVLVLYMTSHGSEDHEFSLSLWPLGFARMDPAVLKSLLDESGIRNRVVIVSACFSGGFVEPLKDPDTLVITAAASDRTSFGCTNEAEWTYFGKAYFDEALRGTHSFTKAFQAAQPRIAKRETEEGFDPSNPQISVGERIAVRLDELERQLDGAATGTGKPKS